MGDEVAASGGMRRNRETEMHRYCLSAAPCDSVLRRRRGQISIKPARLMASHGASSSPSPLPHLLHVSFHYSAISVSAASRWRRHEVQTLPIPFEARPASGSEKVESGRAIGVEAVVNSPRFNKTASRHLRPSRTGVGKLCRRGRTGRDTHSLAGASDEVANAWPATGRRKCPVGRALSTSSLSATRRGRMNTER